MPAPRLDRFTEDLGLLLGGRPDEATILAEGAGLLAQLIGHDDWLPAALAQPDPVRYRQNLLYKPADGSFSVVAFVWGPGQSTPIHNHTVWGLIGVLRGAELSQRYGYGAEGRFGPQGHPDRLDPGAIDAVSPRIGDIHRVSNAFDDRVSISIHVYGGDIGTIERSVFDEAGHPKPFVSSYANVVAPAGALG
jgi:predicted metal-dependent enzyme (double-stranded beta helix superfamily)